MTIEEFRQELKNKRDFFINSRGRLRLTDTGPQDGISRHLTIIILTLMATVKSSTQDRLTKYRGQHITGTQEALQLLCAAVIMPALEI